MEIDFSSGLAIGFFLGFLIGSIFTRKNYGKTLVLCKDKSTPEKLIDGSFCYIVSESKYNEMKQAQLSLIIRDHLAEAKNNRILTPTPHA